MGFNSGFKGLTALFLEHFEFEDNSELRVGEYATGSGYHKFSDTIPLFTDGIE